MPYLIDGYNLAHAIGMLPGRLGPRGLEKPRLQLLDLLRRDRGAEDRITVVFDAHHHPPGLPAEKTHDGIRVCFAVHQDQADDLIELLIRQDSTPRQLVVVSDDHRLQRAARRRHCTVLGCQEYLDQLERWRSARPPPTGEAAEKTVLQTDEDRQFWLSRFADLEKDPDWKELTDPFGFDDLDWEKEEEGR